MRFYVRIGLVSYLFAFVSLLHAQLPSGSISGIATDPSGKLMQGAHVTATDEMQGTLRESTTNADGSFTLSNLAPASYTVVLAATGFSNVQYNHVQVEAGKAITLDTTMNVAGQTSTVDVSSNSSQEVDLTQSMLQGQITSRTIESIPLNGRNFLELAFLLPGNRPAPNFDPTKTNTIEISSAGGFGRGGNILVDGADNPGPGCYRRIEAVQRILSFRRSREGGGLGRGCLRCVSRAVETIPKTEHVVFVQMIVDAIGEKQVAQRSGRGCIDDVAVERRIFVRRVTENARTSLDGCILVAVFNRTEVEEFVLVEWAADRSSKLLAVKGWYRLRTIKGGGQALQVPVALEYEYRAVCLVLTRARDDIDDAVARAPYFCRKASRCNLKLADGVFRKVR